MKLLKVLLIRNFLILSSNGIFPDQMVNDSTMVMNIRFEYLIEHIESKDFKDNIPKFPDRKEKLRNLVDGLKLTGFDNPVLMFVTFNRGRLPITGTGYLTILIKL